MSPTLPARGRIGIRADFATRAMVRSAIGMIRAFAASRRGRAASRTNANACAALATAPHERLDWPQLYPVLAGGPQAKSRAIA